MKAIIIDDEKSARNVLKQLLLKHCPNIEILALCENLEYGVSKIKECNPDLVFLDIEMPNYSGYEIVNFFEEITFEIIFVTAYDKYAMKAFELAAIDYILKPIDIERLKIAVNKFIDDKRMKDKALNYQVLLASINKEKQQKIIVQVPDGKKAILLSEIIAFEADSAYCSFHTANEGVFLYSKNLKYFEELMDQNQQFFRTHKSWIINMEQIKNYSKSKLKIEMNNGLAVKLSKYRKLEFSTLLKSSSLNI